MKLRSSLAGIAGLLLALTGAVSGCGGDAGGDLPPANKQLSQEEADRIAKQVQEGMKGGYKGAPGAPAPPGGAPKK